MTVAATTAATTASVQRRQGAGVEGLLFASSSDPGEHRYGPPGGLFAVGAIGAGGAHGLELLELVAAPGAVILVQRHNIAPNWVSLTEI